jgi:hypothetical protein
VLKTVLAPLVDESRGMCRARTYSLVTRSAKAGAAEYIGSALARLARRRRNQSAMTPDIAFSPTSIIFHADPAPDKLDLLAFGWMSQWDL